MPAAACNRFSVVWWWFIGLAVAALVMQGNCEEGKMTRRLPSNSSSKYGSLIESLVVDGTYEGVADMLTDVCVAPATTLLDKYGCDYSSELLEAIGIKNAIVVSAIRAHFLILS
jgi:hypothetical protein